MSSFFDEPENRKQEPTHQGRTTRSQAAVDRQTLLVRRGGAALFAAIVLIALIFGIKGCLESRKQRALKEYKGKVAVLIQQSDQNSGDLFALLNSGKKQSPLDLEDAVNQVRATADLLTKRGRNLEPPDEMVAAQRNLELTLELRSTALGKISKQIRTALGTRGAKQAINTIAAEMQAFLASDVIYSQRVVPLVQQALEEADVSEARLRSSRFLPNLSWLSASTVAEKFGTTSSSGKTGTVAPGLHGFGLNAVSAGDLTLNPATSNRITYTPNLAFSAKFQNQGENDEFDVKVKVSIKGSGKTVSGARTISRVAKGTEAVASIPLGSTPPIGTPVTVTVEVVPVPGEKKKENNKQTYPAIFVR